MYFYAYFALQLYRVRQVWNWIIWEKEGKNKFQAYFKPGVVSSNAARYEYIINTCLCLLPELFCGGNVSCFTIVTYHKHLTTINSNLFLFTKYQKAYHTDKTRYYIHLSYQHIICSKFLQYDLQEQNIRVKCCSQCFILLWATIPESATNSHEQH